SRRGDHVAGKWLARRGAQAGAGFGVVNDGAGLVPGVSAQKFTEISLTHQSRGYGLGLSIGGAIADPVLAHEEEQLFAPLLVYLGHPDRSADGESEIVVAEWRSEIRCGAQVAGPGIRVQLRIAEILIGASVKVSGPRFGDDADLSAGRASIFGG